jgi:flavin-dependent dehydrogenase
MSRTDPAVAVIGGGPAGSATALALVRRGVQDVVLVDATEGAPAGRREGSIGESIPPAATPLLRELGVLDTVDGGGHLPCPGNRSLWGGPEVGFNDFMFDPVGKGYHLDRALFDERLRAAARSEGVDVLGGTRLTGAEPRGEGLELTISSASSTVRMSPAVTVDATGAAGAFTRRLGIARNVLDNLVTVCALIDGTAGRFSCDYTLLEATEDGWSYAARLPGDRMIISFTSDPSIVRERGLIDPDRWRGELGRTRLLAGEIPHTVVEGVSRLVTRAAPVMILSAVVGSGWLAVGDAASAYDPLGSAGITKALGHGVAAAEALARHLDGDRDALAFYQDRVFADFTAHARLRHRLYASEGRWHSAPFWKGRRSGRPSARPYSARNATIGSTRAALRAGSHVASRATPSSPAATRP